MRKANCSQNGFWYKEGGLRRLLQKYNGNIFLLGLDFMPTAFEEKPQCKNK